MPKVHTALKLGDDHLLDFFVLTAHLKNKEALVYLKKEKMVVSSFAAKKLWKKVRGSGKAMQRKIKSAITKRRKKKRGEASVGVDLYYPFSDGEDDIDSVVRRKLRRFNDRLMSCVCGSLDFEGTHHGNTHNQFVYVTDLYTSVPSKPSILKANSAVEEDELKKVKKMGEEVEVVGASASALSSSSSSSKIIEDDDDEKKKSVAAAADLHAKVAEADEDAEEFIAKFYDDMRLQRQKSLVEYREMLDRGAA